MMSLGVTEMYEPVIDKEYSDEEIEELYQKALDKYIEETRACYDEPPEVDFDGDYDPEYVEMLKAELEAYENRGPFDEEEAAESFRETYEDNLEEPDADLPDWVREKVDPRILAMYFIPEKTYRKLADENAVDLTIQTMITDEDLVRLYNKAKAVVYSPYLEPFGYVPLEAMACGTPVVGVKEGGIKETVLHKKTGLLTQRDQKDFARAIELLFDDEVLWNNLSQTGVRYIDCFWTLEHAGKRLINNIERILEQEDKND
jgi:glycosyltransferase involved in cell wall biosynthesis